MIKATCLLAALILTGCTLTTQDMRSASPYAQFTSKKTPDELSKCIANGLEQRSYAGLSTQVSFRPIDNGVSIATGSNVELIDITHVDNLSKIKFYSAFTHTWTSGNQDRIDAAVNDIKKCI